MARSRKHSVEEVLNFTVDDVPKLVIVEGWLDLPPEQREQCLMKLRDLARQRGEVGQSLAVDANELEEKLKQVESSPQRFVTPDGPDPGDPREITKELEAEREAHQALVDEHGRPCYSIELGFDVFDDPGQYKDIISYWQEEGGLTASTAPYRRSVFLVQLNRWKKFRQLQQDIRQHYHIRRKPFSEYRRKVLERRRRHGLDGDVHLLEDRDQQTELTDWMEYQDVQIRHYERLKKEVEEAQTRLESSQRALVEAGVPGVEGLDELDNFGVYYGLTVELGSEKSKARKTTELAEQKLRLAEKRLETSLSNDLGDKVERAAWVRLFMKEFESAQVQLDKFQGLEISAKRDLEPFNEWFQAKQMEWEKQRSKRPEKAGGSRRHEGETSEFQAQMKKLKEGSKKAHEASMQRFDAEKEMEFAEEGLRAARSDGLEETVERATLITTIQEEIQTARTQIEASKESAERIKLRSEAAETMDSIGSTRSQLERQKILVEWVEQQRREMVRGCIKTEEEGNHSQVKRARSSAVRNPPTGKGPSKAKDRKRKQSTARSILSPTHSSKVSKAPKKRQSPRWKRSVRSNPSPKFFKAAFHHSPSEPRRRQAFKVEDVAPPSLRPIHSSRVSKSGGRRPRGLRTDGTKPPPITTGCGRRREQSLGMSPAPS
ncbi:MAG: hypothetical protein M1817_001112 [Caeruleum heppii]|nr:MAG: hypothetical protein M1817_001112 [Caeruleum heppii]